ncbi:MAG: hypothetical protein O3C43_08055 [Verrucomicrobia bacterium]|nr:hypothetical protein [Verrucomicrobiota bacterium]MDA1066441.1 hypothetical protein [Verrucomicrobiota bacterium]
MNRSFILKTFLLPIFLFSSVLGVVGQEMVAVFLKPDSSSYQVTTLAANDSRLAAAAEMPYSTEQSNVWKWVELNQTFEGFVRKGYVTKGLTVQVGAPVYFVPGDEDAFLTILEDGASAEVVQAAGEWIKISVTTSVPVYFETDTPATAPGPAFAAELPSARNDTAYEVESAVVQDEIAAYEPLDLSSTKTYPGEPIDRILEGKLVVYKGLPYPFNKPTYQWQILNSRKKRMAFVDPRNLILDRPFESYLGQKLSLAGSIYRINKGRDLVIVASQLTVQ